MAGVNKVMLVGRLGHAPELRFTPNGDPVANFSMATQGAKDQAPEWHQVVVWGKAAQAAKDNLQRGSMVYVEGRLQTQKYQDKKGCTQYRTKVVAYTVQYLDRRSSEDSQPTTPSAPQQPTHAHGPGAGGGTNTRPPVTNRTPPPREPGMDSDQDLDGNGDDRIPF